MTYFNDLLCKRQAVIISDLTKRLALAEKERNEYKPRAIFYQMLETEIAKNDVLLSAWQDFIVTLQLCVDDDIPGLTSDERKKCLNLYR